MELDQFLTFVTAAVQTIFSLTISATYEGHGQNEPTVLNFTVENPTSNPDFEWPYEVSPVLIAGTNANSEEYRTNVLSGLANRVLFDLFQQWITTQDARPIKQPVDHV